MISWKPGGISLLSGLISTILTAFLTAKR